MLKKKIVISLLTLMTSTSVFSQGFRQHGAHVHGYVLYDVAQENNELLIEITSPGMDVVGFEHDPQNINEQNALEQATQRLKNAHSIITIAQDASCSLVNAEVTKFKSLPTSHPKPGAPHNPFVDHSSHNSFDIQYQYTCKQPEQLTTISTHWFDYFKATKIITVNYVTDKKQSTTSLDKSDTTINFS